MKQHLVQNTAVGDVTSLYCSSPCALCQYGLRSAKTCRCINCINKWNSWVKLKIVCNIETPKIVYLCGCYQELKPPFCLQGMRSDKSYFITFCWDLSQTDVGKVKLVLSSSSVAADSWIFQIFVEERTIGWSYFLCTWV